MQQEKITPFYDYHKLLGAKMTNFSGFTMPVYYSSILAEHKEVQSSAGVFDVSHMGEFILKGSRVLDLLQKITCNDVSLLYNGKAQYNCLVDETGGIIDDVIIYCLEVNKTYMMVVNAGNILKDKEWILKYINLEVELVDISDKTCLIAVQGPAAKSLLSSYCQEDILSLPYYHFIKTKFLDIDNVLISCTGYTGLGGVEIYFANNKIDSLKVWDLLINNLKIKPIGLGARDSLRLEKGFCLYGHEIDETINPLEAGLAWITKWNKEFLGKNSLLDIKKMGLKRKLVGLVLNDKAIPRQGFKILNTEEEILGQVTSGALSPTLNKGIALGFVDFNYAKIGQKIYVEIRQQKYEAEIVKLPFV